MTRAQIALYLDRLAKRKAAENGTPEPDGPPAPVKAPEYKSFAELKAAMGL